MKFKISLGIIILVWFVWFTWGLDIQTECEQRQFVVTAYYSPVSSQAFYYRPDFVQEKILNGEGIAGAGWKKVFNGMLAGPSSYPFGSVIYLPWLGIWQIEDRWGAIVHAGERWHVADRIDIWMWRWEEWLVRALTFGKQTLTGYYCEPNILKWKKIKIWFDMDKVPFYNNLFDIALWVVRLEQWRTDIWVSTLQKYLIKLGYLQWDRQTWFFGQETKDALCRYQVAKWILRKGSVNCGIFSSPTSFVMKRDVSNRWLLPGDLWSVWSLDYIQKKARKIFQQVDIWSDIKQYFTRAYNKWEKSDDIKKLQTILTNLSYYTWDIDWVFDLETISALYDFQLKNKILSLDNKNLSSRWWLGPATRNKLNGLVNDNEGLLVLKDDVQENPSVQINPQSPTPILVSDPALPLKTAHALSRSTVNVFQFYRPYKKGDQNWEVRILQNFLSWENLYKWKIDWLYSVSMINALCQFQKNNNLWAQWDPIALCGYLGPKTREIINLKL